MIFRSYFDQWVNTQKRMRSALIHKTKAVSARIQLWTQDAYAGWKRLKARAFDWAKKKSERPANDHTHYFDARSYSGSLSREYVVHTPSKSLLNRARPLVVVLHGCRQTNRDIEHISNFNQLADRHGFLVAYPFVTRYRGMRISNCWGWWFDREIHAGAGEVEDLWQIVEDIKASYPVNERRIHVTGLSSGAGMAVAMMVAHANKIASGAAVAGVAYSEKSDAVKNSFNRHARNRSVEQVVSAMNREMGKNKRAIPLTIVHSHDDETVDIQSARNIRDSWGQCFDIDTQRPYNTSSGQTIDTAWECNMYRNSDGRPIIETLFLKGPGHGWYGGNSGAYSYPDAPDVSDMIWKFFKSHPLH